jgi:putative FmdB family regulatory protein
MLIWNLYCPSRRRIELPLYEYRCLKCNKHSEKIEKMDGPHLKKCPHCGSKVESVLTAPAIQFKGSGWYVTDYGRKTSGGDSKADKGETAEKSDKSEKSDKLAKSESKSSAPAKEEKKASSSKQK